MVLSPYVTLKIQHFPQFVSNKTKGRISKTQKQVFEENKARHIFRKNEHFLPPDSHTFVFRKIWRALFSWNTRFWDSPFCLITDELKLCSIFIIMIKFHNFHYFPLFLLLLMNVQRCCSPLLSFKVIFYLCRGIH